MVLLLLLLLLLVPCVTRVVSHKTVMLEPVNREYLCRLAKQWSDLTYEEGATVEQIQEVNSKAMEYAERVISMAPKVGGCVGVLGVRGVGEEGVRGISPRV